MKLGTVTYNLAKDWDIDTIIAKLSTNGFEGVELRTTHAHGVELSLTAAQRTEVKRKFSDSPITLVGLGGTYEYHSADPEVLRANVEGTKEYARLAADVGATGIKVRPNNVEDGKGIPREKTWEQIGRAWNECAAFAADYGVQVRMEVHGHVTQEPANFLQILQHVEHPNAKICWNCNAPDVTPAGTIKPNFDKMAGRIALVHMRDLYWPDYPWQELMTLLQSINYQGFCLAEIPETAEPERIMGYYRALFDAYNEIARLRRAS